MEKSLYNVETRENNEETKINEITRKSKSAFKATVWYLICDFILKGLSFITMPIFTRIMSAGEIGSFSVLSSWIGIFSIVVTLNLVPSVLLARFDYRDRYDEFISCVSILGIISASVFYISIIPFREVIADIIGIEIYALDIMCVHLIFCQLTNILVAKYRAFLEYKKSIAISLGSSVLITASAVLCTVLFEDSLKGRTYGVFVPTILINIIIFLYLYRKNSLKKDYCKYALAICLPLIIHNLGGNIMHTSDRIMIGKICSKEDVGLYGVAYSCAMVANMLRNSMNSAWNPWVYEKINGNKQGEIKKASYVYLISFSILCLGIIAISPELLFIMGGKSYLSAKYVIPPVVTAYMFSMVYSLYSCIESYYKKQKFFAIVAIICAIVNILLNMALIPVFGYIVAAYTTLVSTALECLLHFINVRRMGYSYIYNTKFNVAVLVIMVLATIITGVVYQNNILRFTIIGIVVVLMIGILFIKRRTFVKYIKERIVR